MDPPRFRGSFPPEEAKRSSFLPGVGDDHDARWRGPPPMSGGAGDRAFANLPLQSLSTGQGFYTIESLEGVSSLSPLLPPPQQPLADAINFSGYGHNCERGFPGQGPKMMPPGGSPRGRRYTSSPNSLSHLQHPQTRMPPSGPEHKFDVDELGLRRFRGPREAGFGDPHGPGFGGSHDPGSGFRGPQEAAFGDPHKPGFRGPHESRLEGSHRSRLSGPHESRSDGPHESRLSGPHESRFEGLWESSTFQGPHESRLSGPLESRFEGLRQSRLSGPCESRFEGPCESRFSGPHESRFEGLRESRLSGPRESRFEGLPESRLSGAHLSRFEGLHESRLSGPCESRFEGPRESRLNGPLEPEFEGLRASRLEGPRESQLNGPREPRFEGPRESGFGGRHEARFEGPHDSGFGGPHELGLRSPSEAGFGGHGLRGPVGISPHPGPGSLWSRGGEHELGQGGCWNRDRNDEFAERVGSRQRTNYGKDTKKRKFGDGNFEDRTSSYPPLDGKSKRGSGWCSVCKIDCKTPHVLQQHCNGKRHKRELEILAGKKSDGDGKMIETQLDHGDNEDDEKDELDDAFAQICEEIASVQNSEVKEEETAAEMGKPVEKALNCVDKKCLNKSNDEPQSEGVGEKKSVEICDVCNVTCYSKFSFESHLGGKKHAARLKKVTRKNQSDGKNGTKVAQGAAAVQDSNGNLN